MGVSEWVGVVTSVVGIISVIILISQSIILRTTIKNQIYQNFVNNSLEIDRSLISHPQMRKYVYEKEPVSEDTQDIDQLMGIVELIVDVVENIYLYQKHLPKKRKEGWLTFAHDMEKSPAYKFYMKKYRNWYKEKD